MQERRSAFPWSTLYYEEETGRLFNGRDDKKEAFRDETYVVVQIDKGYDDISLQLQQATLTELVEKINKSNATNEDELAKFARDFARTAGQLKNRAKARSALTKVERGNLSPQDAQSSVFELMEVVTGAVKTQQTDASDMLASEELESLLRKIRRLTRGKFDDSQVTVGGLFNSTDNSISAAAKDAITRELIEVSTKPVEVPVE